jgi:hypothetical protein
MLHSRLGTQQQQSVGTLTAKSVASASRLNLFEAIWRHITASTGCLCSIVTLSQSEPLYHATELPATGIYLCLVPRCGGHSGTRFNLHQHVLMQHPQDLVFIPIEGSLPLPKCACCGLQTPVEDISQGHHCTGLCQRGWERKCQHEAAAWSKRPLEHTLSVNGEELERVEVFKYLGRLISHDDADTQAMRSNLRKAHGCWAWVSHVLRAENATKTCGIFYTATMQAVLLYGSETWSLSPLSIKHFEGFHICAVWRMSGKRPVRKEVGPGGTHARRMCCRQLA